MAEAAASAILLVDDRPESLDALVDVLRPVGAQLVTARSGSEALRRLLDRDFALIVLDVQMPGMDGFETAELVKRRERTAAVPIIFLTASSPDEQLALRAYSVGAVDYVLKPIDPVVLRAKVAAFVDLSEKTEQLKRQAELLRARDVADVRRADEARYRNLADSLPELVWTARLAGSIDHANRPWLEYTGLTLRRMRERGWWQAVHGDERDDVSAAWAAAVERGAGYELECRLLRQADGAWRWHLGRVVPTHRPDGARDGWVATHTDIDALKRAEQRVRTLHEAGKLLGHTLEVDRIYESLWRIIGELMDCDSLFVSSYDPGDGLLRCVFARVGGSQLEAAALPAIPLEPEGQGTQSRVVRSGQPLLIADYDEYVATSETKYSVHESAAVAAGVPPDDERVRSALMVPLLFEGQVRGVVQVLSNRPAAYDEEDLRLLDGLMSQVAAATTNAELYEEASRRADAARVLAKVADGVLLIDGNGGVRLWNPAAESITGLTAAAVLGRRAEDVVPGWEEIAARVELADAPGRAGARSERIRVEVGGEERWLDVSGVAFEGGRVYAFHDATAEWELNRAKEELVATVSHELRTPLTAVLGFAELLVDRDPDEETRRQYLKLIHTEAKRLTALVNDFLDIQRLGLGRLQLTHEPIPLGELVREQALLYTQQSPLHDVKVERAGRGLRVNADRGRIVQLLGNLFSNAIKYWPRGGTVLVRVERRAERVRVSVVDRGIGIPASQHGRVFEKFFRADSAATREVGGTGLGLALCKEIAEAHGGTVGFESVEGEGSTFWFELDLLEEPAAKKPARPAAGSRARRRG